MFNRLDAFRVTVIFSSEHATFAGVGAGALTVGWVRHAGWWPAALLASGLALAGVLVWPGARHRID